ncbi:ester cyclase [Aliifodinibius sp. S!AR15-10]|uniref:ester cyclase n=1 Tax=Aliifodinibius sp. S!AR15-10 TaxID=2950437 RepID=UPI00285BC370|nr:ester cyclase [Aliifodinibius sp. S!AR15-10]MDR8391697.1 ester cyclase [Aliifodinibius sp. S!AR15-10]
MANLKKIVEEYLKAIPKREFDKARKLMHPKYSYTGADGKRHEGIEAGIGVGEMYTNAFPDLRLDVKYIHVAGNIVVAEFVGSGTHKGELMGITPTGKKAKVPVCSIMEFRDDKIYAEREYFDTAVMLQQLGVEVLKPGAAV